MDPIHGCCHSLWYTIIKSIVARFEYEYEWKNNSDPHNNDTHHNIKCTYIDILEACKYASLFNQIQIYIASCPNTQYGHIALASFTFFHSHSTSIFYLYFVRTFMPLTLEFLYKKDYELESVHIHKLLNNQSLRIF